MPIDWVSVAGITPSIAMDFVSNRYFGASFVDITTTRAANHDTKDAAGNTVTFGANSVRRTNLGLRFNGTDEAMVIGGNLATLMAGSQGWLMIEVGVSEVVENTYDITNGPNNTTIIGGAGNQGIIGRGGNGALSNNFNGTASITGASTSPGNGRNFDSSGQVILLTWDASGNRKICLGGGTVVTGTGGIGNTAPFYIGRRGNNTSQSSGLIRSIRAGTEFLSDTQMQYISFYLPTVKSFLNPGDSMGGASGVASPSTTGWFAKVANASNPDLPVFSMGVGGETVEQIAERFFNTRTTAQSITDPRLYDRSIFVFFAGHNFTTAEAALALYKSMIGRIGGEKQWLIVLPVISTGVAVGTADYQRILDMRAAFIKTFPAERIIDHFAIHAAAAPSDANVASGWTPSTMLADPIHDNQIGQDITFKAVYNRVIDLGWLGVGGEFPIAA